MGTAMIHPIKNERGAALVIALLMLSVTTIIGIAAGRTSEVEVQISNNLILYKNAFYAADAGTAYIAANPSFYGNDNITVSGYKDFPNNDDPSEEYTLSSGQSVNGDVEYVGNSTPPRGSGYAADKFKAHNYHLTCNGKGPNNNAQCRIEVGFYRIGF